MNKRNVIIVAITVVAIMLIGEGLIYLFNPYHSSIDIKGDGEKITYTIDSSYDTTYDVVVIENSIELETVYLFKDANYKNCGVSKSTTNECLAIVKDELKIRGMNSEYADANKLLKVCNGDNVEKTAIVFMSGDLPNNIYKDGVVNSPLITYLKSGGHIYWAGETLGKYCAEADGSVHECPNNPSMLFFGEAGCLTSKNKSIDKDSKDRGLGLALNTFVWDHNRGLKSEITTETRSLCYDSSDGFGTTVIAKVDGGSGSICIFSPSVGVRNLEKNVAQVISSQINYDSNLIDHFNGRGRHIEGTLDLSKYTFSGDISVYIYLGEMFASCGKCYHHEFL